MKKATFISALVFVVSLVNAQTFTFNTINYEVTSPTTAKVIQNFSYTGVAIIPTTVTHMGTNYTVTSLGQKSFYNCLNLTSVTIPNSILSIESEAFSRCFSLANVVIPNSVITIGDYAFNKCYAFTTISIPNSVTSIGNSAFQDCYDLETIDIPNSVTTIGSAMCYYCSSLISIEIPDSITIIPADIFDHCTSLVSVILPDSVLTIGDSSFEYCTSLQALTIPSSVTTIQNEAFQDCTSLSTIFIPNSTINIAPFAFAYCTGLTAITIFNPNPFPIDELVFNGLDQSQVSLYVLTGSEPTYQAAPVWQDFNVITYLKTNLFNDLSQIKFYPNPTSDYLNIDNQEINDLNLQVFDCFGRLLMTKELNPSSNIINVMNYNKGIYFFKINNNKIETTKIIIVE